MDWLRRTFETSGLKSKYALKKTKTTSRKKCRQRDIIKVCPSEFNFSMLILIISGTPTKDQTIQLAPMMPTMKTRVGMDMPWWLVHSKNYF